MEYYVYKGNQMQYISGYKDLFTINGGGSYDQEGNQNKVGKWKELDKRFWINRQIIYAGEYNVEGMKVGRWDIMYDNEFGYKTIGDGSYDQEGSQKKI
ncbi:unnamed protein product [Paramecium sonneborni]|uniref:Uncharacterized protein n=1 Tax=Paramecium sonneborni TaxID=65129 RepID=A0A8S1RQ84_9CILI|nr:unnamed protein product [Paramecium sonneborni]